MPTFDYVTGVIGGCAAGLTVVAGAVFPYSTLAEINKRVAGSRVGRMLFSNRVSKGLVLVFQLKGRADRLTFGLDGDGV